MESSLFNRSTDTRTLTGMEILEAASKKKKCGDVNFHPEMSPNEVADIVSGRLMEVIRAQFKAARNNAK